MANIVESLMDKIKFPEKMELSQADRQLLQSLAASMDELKAKDALSEKDLSETEQRLLVQLRTVLKEDIKEALPVQEPVELPEITVDFSELKSFLSEKTLQENRQIKSLIEEKSGSLYSQLQNIKISIKDEEILNKLPALLTQLTDTEHSLRKQLRTVKIMMGFSIWISIMTLAAMVAMALGLI